MPSRLLLRFALALPLTGLAGCSAMSGLFSSPPDHELAMVDTMLDQVERLHVESVLSRERMKDALLSLREIVSPDFQGDALASYALFVDAVERSEEQQRRLEASVGPMQSSAKRIFKAWNDNLAAMSSESMRRHAQDRLAESKARYEAILDALAPAQAGFAEFNSRMRDHALFLGLDYNATAVAELGQEVGDVLAIARELDGKFQACDDAAAAYVQETALRGQEQLSRTKKRAKRPSLVAEENDALASNVR